MSELVLKAAFPIFLPLVGRGSDTLSKGGGVPANALTLNGRPIMLNGRYITITKAA